SLVFISARRIKALGAQGSLDLETFIVQINNYKADYLVVDSANSATRSLVNTYFGNPAFTPPGFYLVFTNTVSGLTISVYDVRQIASFNGPLHLSRSALIEDTEAFEGTPNTPYGNLTVLSVGWGAD